MAVALFLILNCQVNVCIIAKPDLTGYSIFLQVIIKCLRPQLYVMYMCLLHNSFLFVFLCLAYLVVLHSADYGE